MKTKTFKSQVLDFVEQNGGQATWKEIHSFMLKAKGLPDTPQYRGHYSSYFTGPVTHGNYGYRRDFVSKRDNPGLLCKPSNRDPRYLVFYQCNYYINTMLPKRD